MQMAVRDAPELGAVVESKAVWTQLLFSVDRQGDPVVNGKPKTGSRNTDLYLFLGAAITKNHKLGGSNNRKVSSHSPGGWKSKLVPSEVVGETLFQASLLASGSFRHSLACRQCFLCASYYLSSVHICPCVQISPLYKNVVTVDHGPP